MCNPFQAPDPRHPLIVPIHPSSMTVPLCGYRHCGKCLFKVSTPSLGRKRSDPNEDNTKLGASTFLGSRCHAHSDHPPVVRLFQ